LISILFSRDGGGQLSLSNTLLGSDDYSLQFDLLVAADICTNVRLFFLIAVPRYKFASFRAPPGFHVRGREAMCLNGILTLLACLVGQRGQIDVAISVIDIATVIFAFPVHFELRGLSIF
jgi:hypothetical protein